MTTFQRFAKPYSLFLSLVAQVLTAPCLQVALVAACWSSGIITAAAVEFHDIPADAWTGRAREVTGLKGKAVNTVGYPVAQKTVLRYESGKPLAAGQYRLRLKLRASHVNDESAWNGSLAVKVDGNVIASLPAIDFARSNEPEWRSVEIVHRQPTPLKIELAAIIDADVFERVATRRKLKQADDPKSNADDPLRPAKKPAAAEDDLVSELTEGLLPDTHFYFVLDESQWARISGSAQVASITTNKIRYRPGETLQGSAVVEPLASTGAKGTLNLFLEHGLNTREPVGRIPVEISTAVKTVAFEVPLPKRELGHAIVAEFVSSDGQDRSEKSEYFNIAENFNRVAIFGGFSGSHGGSFHTEDYYQQAYRELRKKYANATEHFAWAEEDMVEMSPQADVWYSGQTCYRLNKSGLQKMIAIAHEQGVAQVTYGKFVMSGYLGWKTAWDYPWDHRGQFNFPVGMWEGCNAQILDRFRFKEFVPYEHGVATGGIWNPFWQSFNPINPNPTPRMVRIASEEAIRSIEMFGWDGIRWDGHPRGGGPIGGSAGDYSYAGARRTQSLVRYFKDIIAEKHPRFRHGYNYLLVTDQPTHDWAVEDFELDEVCREGGLLMNESLGNTTMGKPFSYLVRNIQVEGDVARERGGYFLGISYADNPRDRLVECALYFAGGVRPMQGTSTDPLVNRYGTRFSAFTLDETLRRIASPEKLIRLETASGKPGESAKTTALAMTASKEAPALIPWWEPFVYETRSEAGKSRLIVNLLNIPREDPTRGRDTSKPTPWDMPPGTEPATLQLSLPAGYRATAGHWLNPYTLEVTPIEAASMARIDVPSVDAWKVLVIDLAADKDAKSLAEQFGPPRTFGTPRPGYQGQRTEALVLDLKKSVEECERDLAKIAIDTGEVNPATKPRDPFEEDADLAALDSAARNTALVKRKLLPGNSAKAAKESWSKGVALPADEQLQAKPPQFGDLTPRPDGVVDAYVARGPLAHRLDVDGALALLPTVRSTYGTLGGFSYNYYLSNGLTAARLKSLDLVVLADIPYGAIGAETAYGLNGWVKAGGGALFTGGQYSFGKGGYNWTVFDRELLPVQIVENVDTRIARTALPLEPGDDFSELGVKADFAQRPSFVVWNQVALRPGAKVKVFLRSGNRPILVGWDHGQGRVACLLATHQGLSAADAPLFCEWSDWPRVLSAVLTWLNPSAAKDAPAGLKPTAAELAAIVKQFKGTSAANVLDDLLDSEAAGKSAKAASDPLGDTASGAGSVKPLDAKALAARLALIEQLLANPAAGSAVMLAEQLTGVPNLPDDLRWRILDALARLPKSARTAEINSQLAAIAVPAMKHKDLQIRAAAWSLLGLSGSRDFLKLVQIGIPTTDEDKLQMERILAVAVTFCDSPELKTTGDRKLAEWLALEQSRLRAYAGGDAFTLASPNVPLLDSESLLIRIGWLASLAQADPQKYASDFAYEWARMGQYAEYCEITESGIWASLRNATPTQRGAARAQVGNVHEYRAWLERMRGASTRTLESAFAAQPVAVATGFSRSRFQHEAEAATRFLAAQPLVKSSDALAMLLQAQHPVVRHFAERRMTLAK